MAITYEYKHYIWIAYVRLLMSVCHAITTDHLKLKVCRIYATERDDTQKFPCSLSFQYQAKSA